MKLPSPKDLLERVLQELPIGLAQLSHQKVCLLVALFGIVFANVLIFMQLGFKNLLFDGSTLVHKRLEADTVLVSNRNKFLGDNQTFSRRYLYQAAAVMESLQQSHCIILLHSGLTLGISKSQKLSSLHSTQRSPY